MNNNFNKFASFFDNSLLDKELISCNSEDSLAFYIYLSFVKKPQKIVVVMENLLACQNMYNRLFNMLHDHVYMYCVDEISKFTTLASSPEMTMQRIFVLDKLLENENNIIITHTMALKRIVPSKDIFLKHTYNLKVNQECDLNDLIYKLVLNGYKNVLEVTQPFEFSTRGGVIDIYSVNYDKPIRIEFFDTIIDSLRFFDIQSQRTIETLKEVKILPASEFLVLDLNTGINKIKACLANQVLECSNNLQLENSVNEDINNLRLCNFNDYLFKYYSFFNNYSLLSDYLEGSRVYLINENKIIDNERFLLDEALDREINSFKDGVSLKNLLVFYPYNDVKKTLKSYQMFTTDLTTNEYDINYLKIETFDYNLDFLYQQIMEWNLKHYSIYLGFDSKIHLDTIKEYFNAKGYSYNYLFDDSKIEKGVNIGPFDLNIGLEFSSLKLVILGENEIFKKRFKPINSQFSKYKNAITIENVNDLEIGDYVVHDVHGIGIYKGLKTEIENNIHRDYMLIEYKDEAQYYLPLEQFKMVRKYVSKEGVVPKINKLGSKEWEKTKAKVKEKINDLATRLVELYNTRAKKDGFAFAKDDDLQEAFEADFGYKLTKDQQNAVNEIKMDMERPYIMDRLLVGDVGFGKTEVAFIAAFKAINSGKQVALLCPTTLLARQHYLTAIDRFKNFGVRIRLLSRLVSDSETNVILKDLRQGRVDFLIGTHRILSKDVIFLDLGLLIVDEEHKFGVEHKEIIKQIKNTVDVLTLSATPIPRTLQMALSGVRGFSVINTPIDDRMPVQTYVIIKQRYAIKEIIERELARGGQVYYLCNNIAKLSSIATMIHSLVKNATIAIAHGKLPVEETESIMEKFVNNEINILLCTTIIENGIDIPNVNTIIVENADCLGMAQLYQIKGRVGRSNRLAYAYLMYDGHKDLSDIAKKRLQAIKEFTALGSGYKVAMRDLITRGAGDMLGAEQSGFMETVGIDLYIEMLHQAIEDKRNEMANLQVKPTNTLKANKVLNIDAFIPTNYFNNDYERIQLYKQIDQAEDLEALEKLKEATIDKTGHLPDSISLMFDKRKFDIYLKEDLLENFVESKDKIVMRLSKSFLRFKGVGVKIFDIASKISHYLMLSYRLSLIECSLVKIDSWFNIMLQFIEKLSELKKSYESGGLNDL